MTHRVYVKSAGNVRPLRPFAIFAARLPAETVQDGRDASRDAPGTQGTQAGTHENGLATLPLRAVVAGHSPAAPREGRKGRTDAPLFPLT